MSTQFLLHVCKSGLLLTVLVSTIFMYGETGYSQESNHVQKDKMPTQRSSSHSYQKITCEVVSVGPSIPGIHVSSIEINISKLSLDERSKLTQLIDRSAFFQTTENDSTLPPPPDPTSYKITISTTTNKHSLSFFYTPEKLKPLVEYLNSHNGWKSKTIAN